MDIKVDEPEIILEFLDCGGKVWSIFSTFKKIKLGGTQRFTLLRQNFYSEIKKKLYMFVKAASTHLIFIISIINNVFVSYHITYRLAIQIKKK